MESEKRLISIIVPLYNAESYIAGLLDKIIASQIDGVEIIIVNDGSTDGSAEICKRYENQQKFIKLITQENGGVQKARNVGLEKATGEYVAFFDADDYIDTAAFKDTILRLCGLEGDVWVSDFYRVSGTGCVLDEVKQIKGSEPIADERYLKKFLRGSERVQNVWRYIFKREFLLKHELRFSEELKFAEDLEFVFRALTKVKKPIFYHNPYYFYRVNYGATLTMQNALWRVMNLMEALKKTYLYLEESGGEVAGLLSRKVTREFLLNISLCCEVEKSEKEDAIKECERFLEVLGKSKERESVILSKILKASGIKMPSQILYNLKKVKRAFRKQKTMNFDKKFAVRKDA